MQRIQWWILSFLVIMVAAGVVFWGNKPATDSAPLIGLRDVRLMPVRRPIRRYWNPGLLGIRKEIVYERVHHENLTLFVFRPPNAGSSPRPAIVYIHGGALKFGSAMISQRSTPHNRLMVRVERSLIQRGMDFVTVNYRLAPLHPWPDALIDVKAAFRYLRNHAHALDINSGQMAVMGDSAGGELSSFVGLTMTTSTTKTPMVRAVVDLFGPTDRLVFAAQWRKRFGLKPNPVYGIYTKKHARRESAVSYVHTGAPPFLIIQGTQDHIVPPSQSALMKKKLSQAGVSVHEILVHHAGHELVPIKGPIHPGIAQIAQHITRFLSLQLNRPTVTTNQGNSA